MMKLGLGTVQLGVDYGISNQDGKTSLQEAAKVLEIAAHNNVRVIDTAAQYGTSEVVLGKCLSVPHRFFIVTKVPKFPSHPITYADIQWMNDIFEQSLLKLRQKSIYGIMVHSAEDLFAENGHLIMETMLAFKKRGLVQKVGVSVYTGDEIDRILDQYPIDLIQLPINVFDQRLLQTRHLHKLKQANVEIHARSVFLQGLLLMHPEQLPSYFDRFKPHICDYQQFIQRQGLSPIQAALMFVHELKEIDHVICGVNNSQQLQEILNCLQGPASEVDFSSFAVNDPGLLNPSYWKI